MIRILSQQDQDDARNTQILLQYASYDYMIMITLMHNIIPITASGRRRARATN